MEYRRCYSQILSDTLSRSSHQRSLSIESSTDIPRSLFSPSFEMIKRLCCRWLESNHRFYRFIGTVYLQDATAIPVPKLEKDEEFGQFKNQILFSKDRDEKARERLKMRQEVLQELEEQKMIRRKKPKNSSYDPMKEFIWRDI